MTHITRRMAVEPRRSRGPAARAVGASSLVFAALAASAQSVVTPPLRIHAPDGDSTRAVQLQPSEIIPVQGAKPGIASIGLVGSVDAVGLYLVRVQMAPGAINAAHVHPDARVTTVLSGTVFYGIGDVANRATGRAYGPGSVYFTPAGTPHWLIAGDETPAIYEEAGFGPSRSTNVAP